MLVVVGGGAGCEDNGGNYEYNYSNGGGRW